MVSTTRKTVSNTKDKPMPAAPVAAMPSVASLPSAAVPTAVAASAPVARPPRPATAKRGPVVRKGGSSTRAKVKQASKPVAAPKTVKLAKAGKAAQSGKAAKPTKVEKPKKAKLVRDSFTIPKPEYVVLEQLKQRAGKLGAPIKKSELLRAGIKALAAMDSADYLAALAAVPAIKTGRPAKA